MKTLLTTLGVGLLLYGVTEVVARSPISGAKDGVAIQGYDPVAYFTQKSAVRGSAEQRYEWAGVVWLFSSPENRELFAAEPAKYAPQYGGHCALSVANGKTAQGSGEAWTVYKKKLYLNASTTVQSRWEKDQSKYILWADREWPQIKAQIEAE